MDNTKSALSVAEFGYQAMPNDELVAFNEPKYKLALEWIVSLMPRKMVLKLSDKQQKSPNR